MTDTRAVLFHNLDAAKRMAQHLARSRAQVAGDLPLYSEGVNALGDAQVDRFDLFLARFGKLQDFMVAKLFRSIALASLEDTGGDVSLLDTLRRMEKFGIVADVEERMTLRLLRNAFAHEYLTDTQAIAENINRAYEVAPLLAETLARAEAFVAAHVMPDA